METSTLYAKDLTEGRKQLRTVFDEAGRATGAQGSHLSDVAPAPQTETTRLRERPRGLKPCNWNPEPQKTRDTKRCFEWTRRPTGYENVTQYESVTIDLGKRPSHPISPAGVVSLGGKRSYPEASYAETGIPPPALPKAPDGRQWGGWGEKGEPGRKLHDRPWEVALDTGGDEADVRIGDMRKKKFSEQKYYLTNHLTAWHLDAEHDIDPVKERLIHHNQIATVRGQPVVKGGSLDTTGPVVALARLQRAMAGKATKSCAEGAAIQWYDDFRSALDSKMPQTAR